MSDQGIHLFATAADSSARNAFWNGQAWTDWQQIGATAFDSQAHISTVLSADGTIHLFASAADGSARNAFWNGQGWSDWQQIGSVLFDPQAQITVFAPGDGTIHLFGVDREGSGCNAFWNGQGWTDWQQIGTGVFDPQAVISVYAPYQPASTIRLFASVTDGSIRTAFWNGQGWTDWQQIGTGAFDPKAPISVLGVGDGSIHLFAPASDGSIRNAYSAGADGESWTDWEQLGSVSFAPQAPITVYADGPSNIRLFAISTDGAARSAVWNGQGWTNWLLFTTGPEFAATATMGVFAVGDGTFHLFATAADGSVRNAYYAGLGWTDWQQIGSALFDPLATITVAHGIPQPPADVVAEGFYASKTGNYGITLTWVDPTIETSTVTLEYHPDPGNWTPGTTAVLPGRLTRATLGGLESSKQYQLRLNSSNPLGVSEWIGTSATTPPPPVGPPPTVVVPSIVGMRMDDAYKALQQQQLDFGLVWNATGEIRQDHLKVTAQGTPQGTRVAPGTKVNVAVALWDSQGYSAVKVVNASADSATCQLYLYDLASATYTSEGSLAYGDAMTVSLTDQHVYELIAVDTGLVNCPGDDPSNTSCQRLAVGLYGQAGGVVGTASIV